MQTTYARTSNEATQLEEDGRRVARLAARESIVLLENDGALPLKPGRIALFGAGAGMTVSGGTGSGEVNVRHVTSVREGLEAAGFEIATAARIDAYERTWHEEREAFIAEQRAKMKRPSLRVINELIAMEYRPPEDEPVTGKEAHSLDADTCLYVLSRQSGEGIDRTDEPGSYRLTDHEIADIRTCAESFDTTIVVLNVGAPIDLSFRKEIPGINALVLMGQLGMESGHALADIISGNESPSGKLAVSWPESLAQVPYSSEFGLLADDLDSADYKEGVYVGYRYYTSFDVKPAYPFGFGLSYATFSQRLESMTLEGTTVKLAVAVENTSPAFAGKHVVQAYASCPEGALCKERVRLVAFAKTPELAPGESRLVALSFPLRELASYDESQAETVLEAGDYIISLGTSALDTTPVATVTAPVRIVLEKHRNLCASSRHIAELKVAPREAALLNSLPTVTIDAASISPIVHEYGTPAPVEPEIEALVAVLSDRQQIDLCVGTGLFGDKRGFSVPGAVGHTTTAFLDSGIPNVELCDGPAGIRLQRRSAVDAKATIRPLDPPLSIYEVLPNAITRFMYGNPKKDQIVYQFVTGFPAASSIAQTWNVDLARQVGDTVGHEMAAFGVTYWLAPALNIVRNPLCGRNFEYYSEDPVISGKMAAAVTAGVQSTPGCFACCKHFAANNQETNRNTMTSNVDERVLREIYLRGFEIAVREGGPASIMSSYNKVNGTYSSENADLLTGILRDEWEFDGVVMTDWLATGRGRSDECQALQAGVDLIMPGGKMARTMLSIGLKTGRLTHNALATACARVLSKTLAARPDESAT